MREHHASGEPLSLEEASRVYRDLRDRGGPEWEKVAAEGAKAADYKGKHYFGFPKTAAMLELDRQLDSAADMLRRSQSSGGDVAAVATQLVVRTAADEAKDVDRMDEEMKELQSQQRLASQAQHQSDVETKDILRNWHAQHAIEASGVFDMETGFLPVCCARPNISMQTWAAPAIPLSRKILSGCDQFFGPAVQRHWSQAHKLINHEDCTPLPRGRGLEQQKPSLCLTLGMCVCVGVGRRVHRFFKSYAQCVRRFLQPGREWRKWYDRGYAVVELFSNVATTSFLPFVLLESYDN